MMPVKMRSCSVRIGMSNNVFARKYGPAVYIWLATSRLTSGFSSVKILATSIIGRTPIMAPVIRRR